MSSLPSHPIDYALCRYGASKAQFRGPAKDLSKPYFAFVGGGLTFGNGVESPFPALLEQSSGESAVNLGYDRAGLDVFLASQDLMRILTGAQLTVIELLGAAHMSNRFYTVEPRANWRFVRASKRLKQLYPEVEFTQFTSVADVLGNLAEIGGARLADVRQELQSAWVARMRTFLKRIPGPKLLLWPAEHIPFSEAAGGTICCQPFFVDQAMLDTVLPFADGLVTTGGGATIAGPQRHAQIAQALSDAIGRLSDLSTQRDAAFCED